MSAGALSSAAKRVLYWELTSLLVFGSYVAVLVPPPSCLRGLCSLIVAVPLFIASFVVSALLAGNAAEEGANGEDDEDGDNASNNIFNAAWAGDVVMYAATFFLLLMRLSELKNSDTVAAAVYVIGALYSVLTISWLTDMLDND